MSADDMIAQVQAVGGQEPDARWTGMWADFRRTAIYMNKTHGESGLLSKGATSRRQMRLVCHIVVHLIIVLPIDMLILQSSPFIGSE